MSDFYAQTTSGLAVRFIYWNASDQVYSSVGPAWVTWVAGDIANYKFGTTEKTSSGTYYPTSTPPVGWTHVTAINNAIALGVDGYVLGTFDAPADSPGVLTLLGKLTGITLLAEWLGLIAGKQVGNTTARTELRATGAGSGTYDETTDSQEAIKDGGVASVAGAVGSVAGAVGSVAGDIGGDVIGRVRQGGAVLQYTVIATLASQTSFTLTAGSADDNAYNGATIIVEDSATAEQKAQGRILDYTGSTKTVTLSADPGIFTMAVGDKVTIVAANANATHWNGLPVAEENLGGTAIPRVSTALLGSTQLSDEATTNAETFFGNNAIVSTMLLDDVSTFDATSDPVDVGSINGSTNAAIMQQLFNDAIALGTVSGSPTAGVFTATGASLSSVDDYYVGKWVLFIEGDLIDVERMVSDYDGTTKEFTFSGLATKLDAEFPSAPAVADRFQIIGRGNKT